MLNVERELERILNHLRYRMRDRGFTQQDVQEVLGWGRSYVSQLLNRQKPLRIEHVLQILKAIDVDPGDFWAEVYLFGPYGRMQRREDAGRPVVPTSPAGDFGADQRRLRWFFDGLVNALVEKRLIDVTDLEQAIEKARQGRAALPMDRPRKSDG